MYSTMTERNQIDLILENGISPVTTTTGSPDASSTTSDSPTPTNSVHEKNWATRYQTIGVCEDQCQLLGTEEESSDKHSSDAESDIEDVWPITDDQHEYYEKQFKTLQPDINSIINGSDAKQFFEKSHLPVEELRKIWQMADVTKDGALSLAEFKIAMHLVVLRKHDISLPDNLPHSLVASIPLLSIVPSPTLSNTESLSSPPLKGKEWTKFADSPQSTLSSPGPKPVNFDFPRASVERNPKILHPVPLRVTPGSEFIIDEARYDLRKLSLTDQQVGVDSTVIKPIQRPQAKKHAAPGPGAIPPPPHSITEDNNVFSGPASLPMSASKKDPPPPPPPRPNRTHFRSSSLDLNKLGKNTNNAPSIPPRISPSVNPAFRPPENVQGHPYFVDFNRSAPHGAFQVYKKTDVKEVPSQNPASEEKKPTLTPKSGMEEGNKCLRIFCRELLDELNSLREERIALQSKLENLNSKSPLAPHLT